ncbi:MAG: hypothetical protein AB7O62_02510 [Pirellulales bacterium]
MHPITAKLLSLALSALLGGVILFGWSAISWMALSWHETEPAVHGFVDQEQVLTALQANALESGNYLVPFIPKLREGNTPEHEQTRMRAAERMMAGPMAFVVVRHGPSDMARLFATQFAIFVAGALLASIVVKSARPLPYWRRVLLVVVVGGAVAIVGHLPNWNWWGFSLAYILVEVADCLIGFFLAGLAIAAIARNRQPIDYPL